jgi:hypothetical protein
MDNTTTHDLLARLQEFEDDFRASDFPGIRPESYFLMSSHFWAIRHALLARLSPEERAIYEPPVRTRPTKRAGSRIPRISRAWDSDQ